MQSIDVRALVEKAVGGEWKGFCERHPALSRAVDQRLIIEQYAQDLRGTPEFLEAMKQLEMQGLAHSVLEELAVSVVRGWLRVL